MDRMPKHEPFTESDLREGSNAIRGMVFATLLSIPLWVGIAVAIRWVLG